MSDLSPAPTPTNEQQDARTADGRVLDDVERAAYESLMARLTWPSMHWRTDEVSPEAWPHLAIAAAHGARTALAAVSAAAPDEREACATCGGRGWVLKPVNGSHWCPDCDGTDTRGAAAAPDEREVLDHDSLVEAVVEAIWPIREPKSVWPRREGIYSVAERVIALATRPAPVVSEEAVKAAAHDHQYEHFDAYETEMGPCVLVQDLPHVLAALGVTVADAPAADDEGARA